MDLTFSAADEAFRAEARAWLDDRLGGPFAAVRGRGGPGDEGALYEERREWERELGRHGWAAVAFPPEHGGRGVGLRQQVIFYEEYARAGGPGRVGIIGEGLVGPTLLAFGSAEQQARFLPGIARGDEIWCQGYSEPDAGSDLANLSTRATLDGARWVIHGQKVWTSLAHWADWCFVLARTDPARPRHRGISYLLVPMDQPGVEIRPIVQITGDSEFNEVFFDGAGTDADLVVGEVNDGWRVAMGTLAFERGASTLGQQHQFENELRAVTELARASGRAADPVLRQRLATAWSGLKIMRWNALRMLSGSEAGGLRPEALVFKLHWATWHRQLGELAMDVLGPAATAAVAGAAGDQHDLLRRLFLFTRADTIYGGSNQIQRNVAGERGLGLPREPRPAPVSEEPRP